MQTAFVVQTRELSVGEKQAAVRLREDGKSAGAIAQTLAIASTSIRHVLKKKETAGVLPVDQGKQKDPKTTISDISNRLQRAGVKVSFFWDKFDVLRLRQRFIFICS